MLTKKTGIIILAFLLSVIAGGCAAPVHPSASAPVSGSTPSASTAGNGGHTTSGSAASGKTDNGGTNSGQSGSSPALNTASSGGQTSAASKSGDSTVATASSNGNGSGKADSGGSTSDQDTAPVKLAAYKGPVEHIFFHPLIIYPKLAFDHDRMSRGFDEWFVTIPEFNKIINELYAEHYILIDIHDLYKQSEKNGKPVLVRKTLKLPEGKKPLILSIDDLNYYNYMRANGLGSKLVLDDQGRVAVYGKDPQGNPFVSRKDGIIPLLDSFVDAHPDFSLNGAKGIVNETGYEGVLGYRTNDTKAADYEIEKAQAVKVIQAMKKDGWTFASHGWGHLHDHSISYARFVQDTDLWLKQVEPLTGPTDLYVFPFGEYVTPHGKKYEYLLKKGFRGMIGVGPRPYLHFYADSYLMDRRHIDGVSLETQGKELAPLINAKAVLDTERVKLLGKDIYSNSVEK